MKLRIHVTKEILRKSAKCTSSRLGTNCAIALAVRDIFPNAFVGMREPIHVTNAIHPAVEIHEFIELPESAHLFIKSFDALMYHGRVKMKPFSFEVDVPEEVIQHIGISQVETILSNSLTLEKV